jgi:hypothetical protein
MPAGRTKSVASSKTALTLRGAVDKEHLVHLVLPQRHGSTTWCQRSGGWLYLLIVGPL